MGMGASELVSRVSAAGTAGDIPLELCWTALEANALGRLAVELEGVIHIFPVNYVVDGATIYFRTALGSKLLAVKENPVVAFEIDEVDDHAAYSIVVKGRAAHVDSRSEVAAADALPLTPWVPTLKLRWARIWPSEVTGRCFRLGPEPDPYV